MVSEDTGRAILARMIGTKSRETVTWKKYVRMIRRMRDKANESVWLYIDDDEMYILFIKALVLQAKVGSVRYFETLTRNFDKGSSKYF